MSESEDARERVRLEQAQIKRLRLVSVIEGCTLVTLLFVAVPLKHLAHIPIVSRIMGPVHGLAFLAYVWTAIETVSGGVWRGGEIARLVLAALVPFGGFTNGPLLRRKAAELAASGPR